MHATWISIYSTINILLSYFHSSLNRWVHSFLIYFRLICFHFSSPFHVTQIQRKRAITPSFFFRLPRDSRTFETAFSATRAAMRMRHHRSVFFALAKTDSRRVSSCRNIRFCIDETSNSRMNVLNKVYIR